MAASGYSRVVENRHWEDYRSLKQYHKGRRTSEFIISGTGTTGAGVEFEFASETTDYIGTEAQAYIRVEGDTATQDGKYVYLQYYSQDGTISDWVTADFGATESDEIAIGGADFWRCRQMYGEVEAGAAALMLMLTDANMGGGDNWAYVDDLNSRWAAQRYYVPIATQVPHSYLGRVIVKIPHMTAAATAIDGVILAVTYTPKAMNGGEVEGTADITTTITMSSDFVWEPCIELEPATEVKFVWSDTTTAQTVWFEADFFEVWAISQPTA